MWIGYGDHQCLRLELDKDGTGYFALAGLLDDQGQFIPHTGNIHRVAKWQPDGYKVTLDLEPLTTGEDRITLTNSYLGAFSMDMDLQISQGSRKSKVTLYRESELISRTARMKEGIDRYRKEKKRK